MREKYPRRAAACLVLTLSTCMFSSMFSMGVRADKPHRRIPIQVKQPAPVAPSGEQKKTTIGDIVISGQQRMAFKADFSSVTITGPNTRIEAPDKRSGSRLTLHADDITILSPRSADQGRVQMRGHLRYAVTQTTPEGERKLEGTAGQGEFRRKNQTIDLSGGVQCELTDPRLVGIGTLRAGRVTVDLNSAPYLYTFDGSSATNDIRFTPKPRDPKLPPESQIGPVHVHHWDSGTFQTGKVARFEGALAVANLQSAAGAPQGQLRARRIQGDFAPSGEIMQAQASGDVHYHMDRPLTGKAPDGKAQQGRQEVTGTCNEATFDPAASRFTLDGDIDAVLVNTLSLAEPAKLLASHLVITQVDAGQNRTALRFELKGAPNHRRLQVTPRASEPKPAVAAAGAGQALSPNFTLGTLTLTGFETGVLEPGKKLELTSDGKQELLLDTSDPKTLSASHLETHHFTAVLAEAGGITQAETGGPVTFHIQQPAPPTTPKTGANGAPATLKRGVVQALDGNSARALYHKDGQQQTITLEGPFNARVSDPEHLASPGTVKGVKDDKLSLDLSSREFVFDSPHDTIVLDVAPLEPPSEAGTKPPQQPAKKRK